MQCEYVIALLVTIKFVNVPLMRILFGELKFQLSYQNKFTSGTFIVRWVHQSLRSSQFTRNCRSTTTLLLAICRCTHTSMWPPGLRVPGFSFPYHYQSSAAQLWRSQTLILWMCRGKIFANTFLIVFMCFELWLLM